MAKFEKLTLIGAGNKLANGKIGHKWWYWLTEAPGIPSSVLKRNVIRGDKGLAFSREIIPFLPQNIEARVKSPNYELVLPLSDCTDPQKAEEVVARHFPEVYALA